MYGPMPVFKENQLVNYRYMSYSPGFIKKVDVKNNRLLLDVDFYTEKFCKWVHWSAVDPEPKRFPPNYKH